MFFFSINNLYFTRALVYNKIQIHTVINEVAH